LPWISLSKHIPLVLHELPYNLPSPRTSTSSRRENYLSIIGPHLLLKREKGLAFNCSSDTDSDDYHKRVTGGFPFYVLPNMLKIQTMNIECTRKLYGTVGFLSGAFNIHVACIHSCQRFIINIISVGPH
jgi:hypothetical protein